MRHHKIIIIFISILSITTIAMATPPGKNVLKGYIKDKNNMPLQGAVIEIPDLKTGAVADNNGYYQIGNLPKGRFQVVVTLISYTSATRSVNIDGELEQNFNLYESAIEKSEVIVTGQSKATEIRRSPVPIVAINQAYLQQNSYSNIIDAMTKVPGVATVTTGPNVSKPFIRGLGYNRILTLYNGMRQEGQQWGDEHGIEVDEYSVDRIEVIKGPSSLIYGSDALAGVVNMIPTPPAPDGKKIGAITTEYQLNNNLFGGSEMFSANKNGFYWLERVSHKQAKDYQNPVDGRVYGTNFSETDINTSLGMNRNWGYIHWDMSIFNDLQAIPDGSRDSATRQFTKQITEADTYRPIVSADELHSYTIPVLHQQIQHFRSMISSSINTNAGRIAFNLGYERSVRREFNHPEEPDIAGLYLQLNTYTYDIKYYLPEWPKWDMTIGLNGMFQVNDVTHGTEFVIPSYQQFDIGPFFAARKTFGKLDISGGIRFDDRNFHNDALYTTTDPATGFEKPTNDTIGASKIFSQYNTTFSGVTGSIGMTYNFSEHFSVKANVARGFRAPNIAEISSNGVHPGTNMYQLGNTDFKPEFSLQEDIGADLTLPHVSISLSVFNNDISNYIYNQKLLNSKGGDSVIVPGNQTFLFTAAQARLYGGELSIDIHPHPFDWLHFENSIAIVNAINKEVKNDSEKYLPFISPAHGTSELRGDFKKPSKMMANCFVKIQLVWYAAQNHAYLAYNTETTTPAYTLFNIAAGTDFVNKKGKAVFNLSVFGNNIFDVAYQDHLNRLKYFEPYPGNPSGRSGIYNMGRNIGLKITVPFNM